MRRTLPLDEVVVIKWTPPLDEVVVIKRTPPLDEVLHVHHHLSWSHSHLISPSCSIYRALVQLFKLRVVNIPTVDFRLWWDRAVTLNRAFFERMKERKKEQRGCTVATATCKSPLDRKGSTQRDRSGSILPSSAFFLSNLC